MAAVKHFEINTFGEDYVVGDVHGCFDALSDHLRKISFNPSFDRLFSVGDLVDRGPLSEDSYEWLSKPWFHAVRGNHEQMAIDYFQGYGEAYIYEKNGGKWFLDLSRAEQGLFVEKFKVLPIALEVETVKGLVGIIHAECPTKSWKDLEDALSGHNDIAYENVAMWSRDKINYKDTSEIEDVYCVYVGHTPLREIVQLGNVVYIDTAACFDGKLTIVNMSTGLIA